jgi:hypothetical protein
MDPEPKAAVLRRDVVTLASRLPNHFFAARRDDSVYFRRSREKSASHMLLMSFCGMARVAVNTPLLMSLRIGGPIPYDVIAFNNTIVFVRIKKVGIILGIL